MLFIKARKIKRKAVRAKDIKAVRQPKSINGCVTVSVRLKLEIIEQIQEMYPDLSIPKATKKYIEDKAEAERHAVAEARAEFEVV